MGLLNFAKTYEEVSHKLSLPEAESGEYVLLVFTKDGHIITHGVDYTPLFSAGIKGLVPGSTGKQIEFLRGNGLWLEITTSDLPIAKNIEDAITNGTTTILNSQQVILYISDSIAANDAMVYKGTISYEDGKYITHTKDGVANEGFPLTCKVGDTYRVVTQATYAGLQCEAGDLITCIKDGSGTSLNTIEYWTAIQTNINGLVKHTVNGTSIYTYSNSSNTFNIYAPTIGGTEGLILLSSGSSAPIWANLSSIIAGDIISTAKKNLLTSVLLTTNGVVSVTVGGTTLSSSPASGTWGISITGSANSVIGELSTGNGLSLGTNGETYNGSVSRVLNLLPATASIIGGIKVDSDSEFKTISVTSTGSIYLTKLNIINALGYEPGASSDYREITIGGVSIGKKTLNFVPSGDVYLKTDSNEDDIQDISFGISWYNISTGKYEIA